MRTPAEIEFELNILEREMDQLEDERLALYDELFDSEDAEADE